ncbi:MAG TPA: ROK family protein [Pirellulales bacterium]
MPHSRRFISRAEARQPFFCGVDVGGTNIKAGVVDDLGRPLSWFTQPTHARHGAENGARRIGESVLTVIEQAGLKPEDIARVGLGAPGTMDIPAGLLLDPPNLPGWIDFPLRDRVAEHCGRPVVFANDAGAASYGEFWIGSGREFNSMVMLTLGTGIGCGIIVDGLSIDGRHSHGAECGHMIIHCGEDARLCQCGRTGHLEAYTGAVAVTKRAQEALDAGQPSSLSRRIAAGETLSPLLVSHEAEAGDELSTAIILDTGRFLGIGIVSLMHTIDPDGVVIGGAMTFGGDKTSIGRRFLQAVRNEVRRRAFPVPAEMTKIDYASLGSDAGYIGAAGLARLAHRNAAGSSVMGHDLAAGTA